MDELLKLSQIAQGIGVVIAVWFGLRQWRQQNMLARATYSQSLVSQAADFNLKLIENDKVLAAWYSYGAIEPNDQTGRRRYGELLVQWLIFHENVYYQNREGLLDPHVYSAWKSDLAHTIATHNLKMLPRTLEETFTGPYREHLMKLRQEPQQSAA